MVTGGQRHCNGGCDAEKNLLWLMKQKGQALIPRPLAGRSCPSCWLKALPGAVGWKIVGCQIKDKGTAAPRLCMGCKDAVRPKSHVGSVSHPRMWDVRRGQSQQAVNPNETLNFRSLSCSALLWTVSNSFTSFMFCGAQNAPSAPGEAAAVQSREGQSLSSPSWQC